MKPSLKLPAKIALLTLVFTMLGVVLVGYVSLANVEKLLREQAFADISGEMKRRSNQYVLHFHELRNTLSMLADSSAVTQLVSTDVPDRNHVLAKVDSVVNDFMAILEHQPTYMQVSLLDMAGNGRERVRVDRRADGRIVRVEEGGLQAHGGEAYFHRALRLTPRQFHLVDHVRREGGNGDSPEWSLRMAVPLFTAEDEPYGLLTISEDFRALSRVMFRQKNNDIHLLLANSAGHLLYMPEGARGLLQPGRAQPASGQDLLRDYFPEAVLADPLDVPALRHQLSFFVAPPILSTLPDRGLYMGVQRIYFDPATPARHLVMVAIVSSQPMEQRARQYWSDILRISLGIALVLSILIILVTRQLTAPLRHLTRTLQRIAAGEPGVTVPALGQDEIGELATTFQTLLHTLNSSHRSLETLAASLEEQVRERTADLAVARDEALLASEAKSVFLATMSHEIRTPMNVILGMLDLLRTSSLALPDRERVDLALGSANTLLTLINNVLDFSKMEAEQFSLDTVDFDLRHLVYESAMAVAPLAHAKEIELTAFFPDVPLTAVRGDPIRLKQIFTNLLGNAIKFTPEGGSVELHGGPISGDATRIEFLFEVRDSGIGVSLADRQKIFNRFTQADSSSTRRHEGTGLGLSICAHLVNLMEGELGVDANSDLPSGSVFYFTVYLGRQQHPCRQDEKEQYTEMRVLAVAHDRLLRTLVEDALLSRGARLDHVADLEHAAAILRRADSTEQPYHLVICNQRPGSGQRRDFRQLLHCNVALSFILLTDLLDQGWDQATELPGTAICLKKPLNADRLLSAVEWLIKHRGRHHVPAVGLVGTQAGEGSVWEVERSVRGVGNILVVDDQQANLVVTRGMLLNIGYPPEQIQTAINGREAVELFKVQSFALVLMDCQMPVMDGFDATRAIHALQRERGGEPVVPIVAFTADVTTESREKIRACGMDGFLSKPVSIAALRAQLQQFSLLQPIEGPSGDAPSSPSGQEATAQEAVQLERVDMEALLRSMRSIGLQEEDFREVADLLAVQFLELLNTMQRDMEQGAYQSARATAHVVKGSMANTIFPTLQKSTRSLYEAVRDQNWEEAGRELVHIRQLFQPIQEALLAFLSREDE